LILSAGIALCGLGASLALGGFTVNFAVVIFSIGEMIASPKSQEYVAAIAPKSKTAMYMGYYFVSLALGNLFAGLSGGPTPRLRKSCSGPF
jgi:POT family proton-dependent oligopeptide transporter